MADRLAFQRDTELFAVKGSLMQFSTIDIPAIDAMQWEFSSDEARKQHGRVS